MGNRLCAIEGCSRDAGGHTGGGRGWCAAHYKRWRRHGDPLHGGPLLRQTERGQPCSIDGCDEPVIARGWCENHYGRWKRHGDPLVGRNPNGMDPAERFWSFVEKTDECWIWTGAVNGSGYGTFSEGGRRHMAHRYAWTLAGNVLTPGLTLDHLCRTTLCVLIEHLEEVTYAENLARRR